MIDGYMDETSTTSTSLYTKNGFEDLFNKHGLWGDLVELALITTEVSEAMNKIRRDEDVDEELADIVIRVMNYCNRKGKDLRSLIISKNKKNLERPYLHGLRI